MVNGFRGAGQAVKDGLFVLKRHPQIMLYPYLAAIFIVISFPLVNGLVFKIWDSFAHETIFSVTDNAPHNVRILLGLVTFSIFYTTLVTAYFTCAVSASVLANLEGRQTSPLYGFHAVLKHFLKVSKFAILAIFFFPISVVAQRHKLKEPKGLVSVIGSSLSLNMSQLAPVILTENKSVAATIRQSVDTLGSAWHENLVIKIGTYLAIFALIFAGLLPKLLRDTTLDQDAVYIISILAGFLISVLGYVITKVIGSVFTATLYHQAKLNKK